MPIIAGFQARNMTCETLVPATVSPLVRTLHVVASPWTCAKSHSRGKQVPEGMLSQLLFPAESMMAPVGTLYSSEYSRHDSEMLVLADVPVSNCRFESLRATEDEDATICPVQIAEAADVDDADAVVVEEGPMLQEKLVNAFREMSELS